MMRFITGITAKHPLPLLLLLPYVTFHLPMTEKAFRALYAHEANPSTSHISVLAINGSMAYKNKRT